MNTWPFSFHIEGSIWKNKVHSLKRPSLVGAACFKGQSLKDQFKKLTQILFCEETTYLFHEFKANWIIFDIFMQSFEKGVLPSLRDKTKRNDKQLLIIVLTHWFGFLKGHHLRLDQDFLLSDGVDIFGVCVVVIWTISLDCVAQTLDFFPKFRWVPLLFLQSISRKFTMRKVCPRCSN